MAAITTNIRIIENHDEAFSIWKEHKFNNAVLIHVDAHFDCEKIENNSHINIGNFIGHAVVKNIINKIIWIIPDGIMNKACCMRFLLNMLSDLCTEIKFYKDYISCNLIEEKSINILICEAKNFLRSVHIDSMNCETLLFDIDMDYFFNDHICLDYVCIFRQYNKFELIKFYELFKDYFTRSSCITICKSVLGGYTPLKFEFTAYLMKTLILQKQSDAIEIFERILRLEKQNLTQYINQLLLLTERYETCVSAWCIILENQFVTDDLVNKFKQKFSNKVRYIGCIHQLLKINFRRLLREKLKLAKYLCPYLYLEVIIALKKYAILGHLSSPIISNDERINYLIGKYYFTKKKHSQSLYYLYKSKQKLEKIKHIQDWEGILTSYPELYKTSPVRREIYRMLAISESRLGHKKESIIYTSYLLRFFPYDFELQNILDLNKCKKSKIPKLILKKFMFRIKIFFIRLKCKIKLLLFLKKIDNCRINL